MITIKNESVMNYRIPLSFVESVIVSKDFYDTIVEYYKEDKNINYEQMSRDLCQAINFTQRMSAVSKPVTNVLVVGEKRISPRKNLVIEFNNRIYDLTNREFNYVRQNTNELDQKNYDEYDKSNSEEMKTESLSKNYYLIRDLFEKRYVDMLSKR